MYKIYQYNIRNGSYDGGRICVGKAVTPKQCLQKVMAIIDAHNDGVILEDPEKDYLYVRGDVVEQIIRGSVHSYIYDNSPMWFNTHKVDVNEVICDVGFEYVYMRKYITQSIHLEDNVEVLNLPSIRQVGFYWCAD